MTFHFNVAYLLAFGIVLLQSAKTFYRKILTFFVKNSIIVFEFVKRCRLKKVPIKKGAD